MLLPPCRQRLRRRAAADSLPPAQQAGAIQPAPSSPAWSGGGSSTRPLAGCSITSEPDLHSLDPGTSQVQYSVETEHLSLRRHSNVLSTASSLPIRLSGAASSSSAARPSGAHEAGPSSSSWQLRRACASSPCVPGGSGAGPLRSGTGPRAGAALCDVGAEPASSWANSLLAGEAEPAFAQAAQPSGRAISLLSLADLRLQADGAPSDPRPPIFSALGLPSSIEQEARDAGFHQPCRVRMPRLH